MSEWYKLHDNSNLIKCGEIKTKIYGFKYILHEQLT